MTSNLETVDRTTATNTNMANTHPRTRHRTGSTSTRPHTHHQHRKSLLDKPTLFRDADLEQGQQVKGLSG